MLADPFAWTCDVLSATPLVAHSLGCEDEMALLEISKRADSKVHLALEGAPANQKDAWDHLYAEVSETVANRLNDVTTIFS